MKSPLRLSLSFFILLFLPFSSAFAEGWVVGKVSQPARYTKDSKNWVTIKRGMKLPKVSWVHVGPRGRLLLKRGNESVLYKANTLAALIQKRAGRKTELRQQFGSLVVDVNTRTRKHTTVKTPFLAAVVKGTKFEVIVRKRDARLKVVRGTVQVTDQRRGERVDVQSGQTVQVKKASNSGLRVSGPGKKSKVVRVKKVKSVVPPVAESARPGSNAPVEKGTTRGGIFGGSSNSGGNSGNGNSGNGNSNGGGNGNGNNGNGNGNGGGTSGGNSGNGNSGNGNSSGGGNGNGNNGNGNGNGGGNKKK